MSTGARLATPPAFAGVADAAGQGFLDQAWRHLRGRLLTLTRGSTPWMAWLLGTALVAVGIFRSACNGTPELVAVQLTICAFGASLARSIGRASVDPMEVVLPVARRVRLAVDTALIALPAALLALGSLLALDALYQLGSHAPSTATVISVWGQGAVLAFPLVAAGNLGNRDFGHQILVPPIATLALGAAGWALGLTHSGAGCLLLAGILTLQVWLCADLDWMGLVRRFEALPLESLLPRSRAPAPRVRPGALPQERLRRDLVHSLGRSLAWIATTSVLGWAPLVFLRPRGSLLLAVPLVLVALPRFIALGRALGLPVWVHGPARDLAHGPWSLLPLHVREFEMAHLIHLGTVGLLSLALDAVAFAVLTRASPPAPVALMLGAMLIWEGSFLPPLAVFGVFASRFRFRTPLAGVVVGALSWVFGPPLIGLVMGVVGWAALEGRGASGDEVAALTAGGATGLVLLLASWLILLGWALYTRPRREAP